MTELEKLASVVDADLVNILNEINTLKNRISQLEREKRLKIGRGIVSERGKKDRLKQLSITCLSKGTIL